VQHDIITARRHLRRDQRDVLESREVLSELDHGVARGDHNHGPTAAGRAGLGNKGCRRQADETRDNAAHSQPP
jgi:hypothetical protein